MGVPGIFSFSGSELTQGHVLTSMDLRTSLKASGQSFLVTCQPPRAEWPNAVLCRWRTGSVRCPGPATSSLNIKTSPHHWAIATVSSLLYALHPPLASPPGPSRACHKVTTEGVAPGPAGLHQDPAPQHCEQCPPDWLLTMSAMLPGVGAEGSALQPWMTILCPPLCPADASGPRILAFLHPPSLSEAALAADPRRFCSPDLCRLLAPILDGTSAAATPSAPPAARRPQSPLPVSSPAPLGPRGPGCLGPWPEPCYSLGLSFSICVVGRSG